MACQHPNMLRRLLMAQFSYLQHVQQSRLSGIVETKEEQLGVLIEESQGGQDVPDYHISTSAYFHGRSHPWHGSSRTPTDHPHIEDRLWVFEVEVSVLR
jgi:hypothetical protein